MFWLLFILGWLACAVYSTIPSFWLLIHPRAEYWRARRRSPYVILLPAWLGMWAITIFITYPWRLAVLYISPWTWLPASLLFATGLWLYRQAGHGFNAKQLGGIPEVLPNHDEQRLVISGIRARVRHPVYLGHLCEMLAWSMGTGLAVCYCLTAFALATGVIMIRSEERELEQRFGQQYRDYQQKVPALLPAIKR